MATGFLTVPHQSHLRDVGVPVESLVTNQIHF